MYFEPLNCFLYLNNTPDCSIIWAFQFHTYRVMMLEILMKFLQCQRLVEYHLLVLNNLVSKYCKYQSYENKCSIWSKLFLSCIGRLRVQTHNHFSENTDQQLKKNQQMTFYATQKELIQAINTSCLIFQCHMISQQLLHLL